MEYSYAEYVFKLVRDFQYLKFSGKIFLRFSISFFLCQKFFALPVHSKKFQLLFLCTHNSLPFKNSNSAANYFQKLLQWAKVLSDLVCLKNYRFICHELAHIFLTTRNWATNYFKANLIGSFQVLSTMRFSIYSRRK